MLAGVWWQDFFDRDYLNIWGGLFSAEESAADVETLTALMDLRAGDRVLDAPCGYGRHTRLFAKAGFGVVGVDQSATLIRDNPENP